MSRHATQCDIRIKVMGDDPDQVSEALDTISGVYKHASKSSVMRSQPRGWHGFVTVYKEGSR